MTRLETFTDAAFAFALTLLVISFEPIGDARELLSVLRDVPAFVVSASLLMVFWWGHHHWSRRFGLDDGVAVILSCVLVFTVMVYVVPLRFMFGLLFLYVSMLTGLPVSSGRVTLEAAADVNTMFAVYGIGFMAMSLALVLLNVHAWRKRDVLALDPAAAHDTLTEAGVWGLLAISGASSALLAAATAPSYLGTPGWVYMALPVAVPVFAARRERTRP